MFKVKDVMVTDIISVDADATVVRAAETMVEHEIGCLLVLDKGQIIGILTERDLLKRIMLEGKDPKNTRVKEIMSTPLIVASPNLSLEGAIKRMFRNQVKKLPVVDRGNLVGLITLTDIARFHPVMADIVRKLAEKQNLPKRIQKVIPVYIV